MTDGLKPNGKIIINTVRKPNDFNFPGTENPHVYTVDCESIALKYSLGSKAAPIVNTTILGAVAKATGLATIDTIMEAIKEKIPVKKDANAKAAQETYNQLLD